MADSEPESTPAPPTRPLLADSDPDGEASSRDETSIQIQDSDIEESETAVTPEQIVSKASFRVRLGTFSLIISIFCQIGILTSISLFCWLWWGSRSKSTLRWIILSDNLKQVVPLISLLVTYSVTGLTALITSMIASIAMEWHGVPLMHLASVSVTCFTNSGQPPALWNLLLRKHFFKWPPLPILVIFCWAMFIATQFTSTLLLSDLGQGPVGDVPLGVNASGLSFSSYYIDGKVNPAAPLFTDAEYWTGSLSSFEAFAEYSQLPSPIDGLDDTGLTLRAFLPIGDQKSRETLEKFTATASVFDLSVACARPTLLNLNICGHGPLALCGNFTMDLSISGLVGFDSPVEFSCELPRQNGQADQAKGVPWEMCFLDTIYGGLIPSLDPTNNQSLKHLWNSKLNMSNSPQTEGGWIADNGNSQWAITLGHSYIIMNATQPLQFPPIGRLNFSSTPSGYWTEASFSSNVTKSSESFFLTVCFDSLPRPVTINGSIQEFDVVVTNTGTRGIHEPTAVWNSTLSQLNTNAVRHQLGALSNRSISTLDSRGVWSLQGELVMSEIERLRYAWNVPKKITTGVTFNTSTYPWVTSILLTDMSTIALCPKCSHDEQRQASAILIQVFDDIITDTGSPALALQAILTLVIRVCYYDWVQAFNDENSGTATRFMDAFIPIHNGGVIAVLVILFVFLLFHLFTLCLFFAYTRTTRISDSWQCVMRLAESPEVRSVMQNANLATDRDVKRWVGGDKERKRKKYRLGKESKANGRITEVEVKDSPEEEGEEVDSNERTDQ